MQAHRQRRARSAMPTAYGLFPCRRPPEPGNFAGVHPRASGMPTKGRLPVWLGEGPLMIKRRADAQAAVNLAYAGRLAGRESTVRGPSYRTGLRR
jgi:hypothetical protein